jgi:hypothetical protein
MDNQAMRIAIGIATILVGIASLLKPPKPTCDIRDVQFMIATVMIFCLCVYEIVRSLNGS